MLDNKITIELQIPKLESEIEIEDLEIILDAQARYLVSVWKGITSEAKESGVKFPTISLRAPVKPKKTEADNAYQEFRTKLIDHHLAREPKANVAQQMQAINRLFQTGRTAEELIALYDETVKEYSLTTWHTVKFRLGKVELKPETEIVTLSKEAADNLRKRMKGYGN